MDELTIYIIPKKMRLECHNPEHSTSAAHPHQGPRNGSMHISRS